MTTYFYILNVQSYVFFSVINNIWGNKNPLIFDISIFYGWKENEVGATGVQKMKIHTKI